MQDINFDELDKAVNSILQKNNKPEAVSGGTPSGSGEYAAAAVDKPHMPAPNATTVARVVPQKRRGQFMDMVHPSSNMLTGVHGREKPVASPVRRPQPSIKPLSADVIEGHSEGLPQEQPGGPVSMPPVDRSEVVGDIDDADLHGSFGDTVEAENRASEIASVEGLFDESSISDDKSVPTEEGDAPEVTEQAETPTEDKPVAQELENQPLAQSPFIESTAVEKRPLGAFSGGLEQTSTDSNEPLSKEENASENDEPKDYPLSAEESIPVELHPDVVSVEADDDGDDEEVSVAVDNRPQSIVQQYKTEKPDDDDDDETEHAVFDTKQYHKPLEPPAKQKGHKIFYIVMGLLMILVGSAAGYLIWILKLF